MDPLPAAARWRKLSPSTFDAKHVTRTQGVIRTPFGLRSKPFPINAFEIYQEISARILRSQGDSSAAGVRMSG